VAALPELWQQPRLFAPRMGHLLWAHSQRRETRADLPVQQATDPQPQNGQGASCGLPKRPRGLGAAVAVQFELRVWVPDPDGIKIQLQHAAYGHGSGPLGDELPPMPKGVTKPAFQLRSISHVTLTVTKGPRSQEFYQKVFGLPVQAMQGSGAALAVGSGPDMIAFNTAANDPRVMAGVDHVCFTIQDFDPNRVMRILVENGLEPIEYGIPALIKPLTCRTRLRQRANNGGGPTYPLGTPELYLNDPDNITLQIQDVTYCGGSGALGQICP
jgi:catechol 2,3-dioxygenase-like lactoylglutathione lyase family enzyme